MSDTGQPPLGQGGTPGPPLHPTRNPDAHRMTDWGEIMDNQTEDNRVPADEMTPGLSRANGDVLEQVVRVVQVQLEVSRDLGHLY